MLPLGLVFGVVIVTRSTLLLKTNLQPRVKPESGHDTSNVFVMQEDMALALVTQWR